MAIRLVLVDDNRGFIEAARSLLALEKDLEVVACLTSGREAIQNMPRPHPDIVLLDLNLRDVPGLDVLAHLTRRSPEIKVVIVTLHDDRFYRESSERAGAKAFLPKSRFGSDVVATIRQIFKES